MHASDIPRRVADLRCGDHVSCLYNGEEELLQILTLYSRLGLAAQEKVVCLLGDSIGKALVDRLARSGIDPGQVSAEGRLEIHPANPANSTHNELNPEHFLSRWRGELERLAVSDQSGLRIAIAPDTLDPTQVNREHFVRLEQAADALVPSGRGSVLCLYERHTAPADLLYRVFLAHSLVAIGSAIYENPCVVPSDIVVEGDLTQMAFEQWLSCLVRRQEILDALSVSESRYRTLFERANDALMLHTEDDEILDVNRCACELFGYSREEMLSLRVVDLQAPQMRGQHGSVVQDEVARWAGRPFEVLDIHKDGTLLPVEISIAPLWDDGRKTYLTIVRDIRERKVLEANLRESEQRFRTMVDFTWDAEIWLDPNCGFLYVSPSWERITGYSQKELLANRNLMIEMAHPDDKERLGGELAKACGGQSQSRFDYRVLRKDGIPRWLSLTYRPVPGPGNMTLGVRMSVRDVTERVRAQQGLAALHTTGLAINSQLNLSELLPAIVERAAQLLGAPMGGLYQMQPDNETLELIYGYQLPEGLIGTRLRLGEGLSGKVALTGRPFLVDDYRSWPGRAAAFEGQPFHRVIGVPLCVCERVIGVINVTDNERSGSFSRDEVRLVSLFADQAAVAIENARLHTETRRRGAILEAMAQISLRLATGGDPLEDLPVVLARLGQAADVDRAYVFQNHTAADGAQLTSQRCEWCAPGISPQIDSTVLQSLSYVASGLGRLLQDLSAGRPFYGLVRHMTPAERPHMEAQDIRSLAVVPIFSHAGWWGFLGFDDCHSERVWSGSEIEALRNCAGVLGAAIARHHSDTIEREQRALAEALRDTALALVSTMDLDELLERILANVGRVVPCDAADIMFIEGDATTMMASTGYAERGIKEEMHAHRFSIYDTPNICRMIETQQPLLVADVHSYPGWVDTPASRWIRSYLAVPILVKSSVIGFVDLISTQPGFFTPEHAERLQSFAGQAAVALNNARLVAEVTRNATEIRRLSAQHIVVQEAERKRIAQELHDEMGQALTALRIDLEAVAKGLPSGTPPRIQKRLAQAATLAVRVLSQIQDLALTLRPGMLDDLGLMPTLHWYLAEYASRTGLEVKLEGMLPDRLPAEVELVLYRIVQEALTNSARHAAANHIGVRLALGSGVVTATISDDGRGFVSRQRGLGLLGMQERAETLGGRVEIQSRPDAGTRVTVTIPLSGGIT